MKKVLSLVLCLVCLFAFSAVGLAETTSEDFLSKVQGTFVELFPELSKDEYHETWVEAVTPLVVSKYFVEPSSALQATTVNSVGFAANAS